jgi:hypothetical protein
LNALTYSSTESSTLTRIAKIPALLLLCTGLISTIVMVLFGPYAHIALIFSVSIFMIGIAGLLMRQSWFLNLSLVACSVTAAVYVAEGGIEALRQFSERRELDLKIKYATSHGRSFDLRSQGEYLQALRAEGTAIYPAFPRGLLLKANSDAPTEVALQGNDGTPLLPLGSISEVQTVRGNETGTYLVYSSDEHGFHNPRGIWSRPQLKIAAVGDSFVQGESVLSELNMIAAIRDHVPETLNLGHGGNGPLSELATILEYLPERKPKIVLWVFCEENDLQEDLEREKRSALMMGYLADPPALQHLERRQVEIDQKLRRYFESLMKSQAAGTSAGSRLREWLVLHDLALLGFQLRHPPQEDFTLFQRVLAAAQRAVSSWEGSLVFVYLPMPANLKHNPARLERSPRSRRIREEVLRICASLSIPVLDIDTRFAADASRLQDYFYPYHAHFTDKGYQRAGELVLDEMAKQQLLE